MALGAGGGGDGRASPAIEAFVGGEWAPQMEGRVGVEKYPVATHVSLNALALKQGPNTKRAGTVFVQPVKNGASLYRTHLRRFEFSQALGNGFQIEFGDNYCRFYTNHGPLLAVGTAAWSAVTNYVLGNLALSGGITYYAIAPSLNQAPPNAAFWYPMVNYTGPGGGAIYEIPSPYRIQDLTDSLGELALDFEQDGDVLYITAGRLGGFAGVGYPPYTLTRFGNNPPNWQFAQYAPTDGPYADLAPLVPGANVAVAVSAVQGLGITITAYGGNAFSPNDIGRLVRIASQYFNVTPWTAQLAGIAAGQYITFNGNNYQALNAGTTGTSPPIHTQGAALDGSGGILWLYTDSGYGVAKITAYTSGSVVTANVLKRFPANVVGATAAITGASQAIPCVVSAAQAFKANDPVFIYGVQGMTQLNGNWYVNQTTSGVSVTLAGLDSTSFGAWTAGGTVVQNGTTEWQLGAWSDTSEWPRALGIYKDRMFLAGKLKLWGSVPGLYTSHTPDINGVQTTDSAINQLIGGVDANSCSWLMPAILLLVGTEGGEYGADAALFSNAPLGPSNVECLRQSKWRCRAIKPVLIGTTVLYVQRAGRKVFAMDYNFYLNRYDSTDQSKYAYHITIGGLQGICMQQEPFQILWSWRTDGTLLSYTFNREDNVTAWCRHTLGGGGIVESADVIAAPDGSRDEIWMIVRRTINGQTVRFVEYMAKQYEGRQGGHAGDALSSQWYVDAGSQYSGAPTNQVTGLQYLTGATVAILADGKIQPTQVVPASGILNLQAGLLASVITVGLPYTFLTVPQRPEGGAEVGTAQGKIKTGGAVALRLTDSYSGQVGQWNDQTQVIDHPYDIFDLDPSQPMDTAIPLFSGDKVLGNFSNALSEQDKSDMFIGVQHSDPCAFTLNALFPNYEVMERR